MAYGQVDGVTRPIPKASLKHVDRCPLCGAWRWRLRCTTPHDRAAAA
jgi:hypothetical protein